LSTFAGRFRKLFAQNNPALLLSSEKEIRAAQAQVKDWANGKQTTPDREMWAARRLAEGCIHPDTDELIPQPARMMGYGPYNGPICVALIMSKSTAAQLFWAWVNQTQNAAVNYCNRNAASPTPTSLLAQSYFGAVGSALAISFGLNKFLSMRFPGRAKLLQFVAFPASLMASSANCYIMRAPEMSTGIPILDSNGATLANGKKSGKAAELAVVQTVTSRFCLQWPVFLLPPLVMAVPPLSTLGAAGSLTASTYIGLSCFMVGLPCCLSIYPTTGAVAASDLEEEFHGLGDETGKVYFYRGL
jgi:hypothetical protein